MAMIFASIGYTYWFLRINGYLPLPFFPDPSNDLMDGYNTAWWTWNGRAYPDWRTVYPPFSFAILRVLSIPACYQGKPPEARYCDWLLISSLFIGSLVNGVIAYLAFRKIDRSTALPRALAITFGLPSLFCLQRGNLLIFAWTGVFLAFAPIIRSTRARWLGIAVAINLKPYFVGLVLAKLLRREWRWAEGALIVTVIVYVLSFVIIKDGSPLQVFDNIKNFAANREHISNFNTVVYSSSYSRISNFLDGFNLPLMSMLGSWPVEFWPRTFDWLIRLFQVISLLAVSLIWISPEAFNRYRILSLSFTLLLITFNPGGYAMVGTIFFIFLEYRKDWSIWVATICSYLLSLPIDIPFSRLGTRLTYSDLAGYTVSYHNWLTVGPFLRPGLIMVIQLMLVIATVSDFLRYHRKSRDIPAYLPTKLPETSL
ncbi:hypothetical protein RXV95_02615 [Novosphingobium sp. ZN18A2]|uniref:hypothetical protein n=1 Tax=Novosphingobium sp. ZN18A2 TaxID=3079861 RepID=UPI0030D317E5